MIHNRPSIGTALLSLLLAAAGCDSPDVFIPASLRDLSGPAGVIDGTLTYSGRAPCTEKRRIVGAAIVLGFDTRLLPPPEGLGTAAASIDVISGEQLFGGIRDQLDYAEDGSLLCPKDSDPPVTVSSTWVLSPLQSGVYQVRGFYDRDGDFDPGFSIANLPTRGDVGGGAIENVTGVLAGEPPRYREITLGAAGTDGKLVIPETGSRVSGVTITLGLELDLERPVFHLSGALGPGDERLDPTKVVMPSDFQFDLFSQADPATEQSFIRLELAAGVPNAEVKDASQAPFFFPVGGEPAPTITYSRQDVNGDGLIDGDDHVPDSQVIPSLFPLSVFSKLADGSDLTAQSAPTVILQGLTLYQSLVSTIGYTAAERKAEPSAVVALRPAALCFSPKDPKRGALVVSRATDAMGNRILEDEEGIAKALSDQFGREIEIAYGCLPEGRYAVNLVYDSGQAWTVPNEAGVCAPSEPATAPNVCGTRAQLASQNAVLTIGPPGDQEYCQKNRTPELCLP